MKGSPSTTLLFGNAIGFSVIAFASYFDIFSHRHLFINTDPWWNPGHLLLYSGFIVLGHSALRQKPREGLVKLSLAGVLISLFAGAFNEFWHRILLFGNPLPEPFPVEPPHALLVMGLLVAGVAALLYPFRNRNLLSNPGGKLATTFISGSLWLIVAGSAFYVGSAYSSGSSYLFAIGAASFASSLFLVYPTGLTKSFGSTTISYLWFLLPYYLFLISQSDGLAAGALLVLLVDFLSARGRVFTVNTRYLILGIAAILYGVIYYPILPIGTSLAVNPLTLASVFGVGVEFALETAHVRTQRGHGK